MGNSIKTMKISMKKILNSSMIVLVGTLLKISARELLL